MSGTGRRNRSRGELDRLRPADLDEVVAHALDRSAQPVGIGVEVLQRNALGADVTSRQRVLGVTSDADDGGSAHCDLETARRLAQHAGDVSDRLPLRLGFR